MNRRQFFRIAAGGMAGAAFATACYGAFESGWVAIDERTLPLPRLPRAFHGTRVAFLTDIHHGPYSDISYIQDIVRTVNLLEPDLILHGGDYSLRDPKYIGPVFDVLADLRAPMGSFGVLGNHDYWHGVEQTRAGMKAAKITELTNARTVFERRGERFVLAGVDDLWDGLPNPHTALGDTKPSDACLLLSHNPDFAETLRDPRVGLVLSGHTHGGQVVFPGNNAPFVPSWYGAKYLRGLVQAPATTVYISRGLGTSVVPARLGSRPELSLITLVS